MFKSYRKTLFTTLAFAISLSLSNSVNAAQKISVPLSGTAIINEVTSMGVSPSLLDIGGIKLGEDASHKITLTHTGSPGDNNILITDVTLSGANSDEFLVEFPGSTVLSPGQSVDIDVTFFPLSLGDKSAVLQINHDGADAEYIVLLKGQGAEPAVSELVPSTASLHLGNVKMNMPITKSLVFSSQGDVDGPAITVSQINIDGQNADDFSHNLAQPVTLLPGESTTVLVTLNSPTYGEKSANLTVIHDGSAMAMNIPLSGTVLAEVVETNPVFGKSVLGGLGISKPTSLQFGPDGRLYVAQMDGMIKILSVARSGSNNFNVTATETIDLINKMVNHNDDGTVNTAIKGRLVTGLIVRGSATAPEIFLISGDPRQGGGASPDNDTNLDTNSGILSKLTKQGGGWVKQDLVRGLPRSEENHQGNGLAFDLSGSKLFIAAGGNTNTGAPSHNFAYLPEVALGGAILEIDLNAIGTPPYDLPTLDDEDRPGTVDANDPFGGNNGKNQAMLLANGPVKVYSPGYRNAYDLVMTESGRLYTFDNGGNAGWGGEPINCSNEVVNGGQTYHDALHFVSHRGYYGGHPNPTRGNKANTFNASNPQSPVEGAANPVECNFLVPGVTDAAITKIWGSTNGIDEYTASNFGGAMLGDLLTASFDKAIYRIELNAGGNVVMSKSQLFTNSGNVPLDLTTQGDGDVFPGTVWVADYSGNQVLVYEPQDY